jgi:signal transduction histidine kinase
MRSLSQMLHPAVLDDYGLAKGIEWYAGVFQRQAGIQTEVFLKGDPIQITGQPAIHCFRIVQEALTNAAKHSGTKEAQVEMEFSADSLKVVVRDFGKGTPKQKHGKPGLGLIAMQERAEILGGKLEVSSTPNVGTTISLLMPLRQEEVVAETDQEERFEEVMSQK